MNIEHNFMLEKYQELKSLNEIIFIKPKDQSKFDITKFNETYKDAKAFEITYHDTTIIFIKEIRYIENFNYKYASRQADIAYNCHKPKTAIELYEKLLLMKKVGVHVYARLGLLYLHENNPAKALRFLIIATGLSANKARKKYDFTDLINKILKKAQSEENEQMNEEDFKNDLEEFTYETRIQEVIILMEFHEMNVEEACIALKICEEEKNIIELYLARDCYARNDIKYGDILFNLVEKRKDKSTRVKKLMQEVRTNRIFYKNRIDENYKPLIRIRTS